MRKVQNCETDNCIHTPSSCVDWNGGDISALGICNGDSLNNVVWEIIYKIEEIAGEDISGFDIDELLTICNEKAPLEINLISILTLIKNNQICLKTYIDNLSELVSELASNKSVNVNLKCYADFDNLGNSLQITRDQLDQLVINKLCEHEDKFVAINSSLNDLQDQINEINADTTVEELSFPTCVNPVSAPTSTQVIKTATEICNLENATGLPSAIAIALANTPADLNTEFGLISGWILTPNSWAQNYGNLLLEVENLRQRLITIENTCCAIDCSDVELGFTASFNDENDAIIIKFTSGAGTNIPTGFTDLGSTITITDEQGNIEEYITSSPDLIANNAQIEIPTSVLLTTGDVNINILANMSNGSLTCSKCLNKTIKRAACSFCVLTASDDVTIIYKTCIAT